jgi:hypothetical protein
LKQSISLAYFIAALWAGIAFAQSPANDTTLANPCLSTNSELGDSAFWAVTAIEQFADKQYAAAVDTVDACFMQWGPEAGHKQKKMHDDKTSCPRTGKVSDTTKKKIEQNYLMNDVSMALWAKASSLHKLGDIESAKETYSQCIYMTCGRAWDPKGWYWSPAQDCAKKVRKLLK